MSGLLSQLTNKYQGIAPKQVINAVQKAANRTGADFSFLMEKAATESNFNSTAKAKTSSATGLFQFIDSTWLGMIKEHGAKYGLGALAAKIEVKGGRLCVDNCDVKKAILNLRKNPEISALMAGEFTTENKQYLTTHTNGDVGAPELYLAHFMGAGGAAKFLNSRETCGDTTAIQLFPKEAKSNKNVFFDRATGKARTLNEVYDFFAQKFSSGRTPQFKSGATPPVPSVPYPSLHTEAGSIPPAPAQPAYTLTSLAVAQALPSSDEMPRVNETAGDEKNTYNSGFFRNNKSRMAHIPLQKIAAESILIMAQMQHQYPPHINQKKPSYGL